VGVEVRIQGTVRLEAMIRGTDKEKSTIFFRPYVQAAEPAARRLRKSETETAVVLGSPRRTNRGGKMSPPPSPTIVKTTAMTIITQNKTILIELIQVSG
jgi:hypothetical protein